MNNIKDLTTGLIYRGAVCTQQNCIKTVKNLQKHVKNCKNCIGTVNG